MKSFILTLAILVAMVTTAVAAPFIECDRDLTTNPPTVYVVTSPVGATWIPATVPALTAGTYGFKIDMVNAPVGTTTIKIKPCVTDSIWGQLCGPETTFPLVRPSAPAAMTGTGLMP